MMRKFLLSILLVSAGFAAGLVVTGRLRTASDSTAQPRERAPVASAQRAAPASTPQPSPGPAGGPDFTRIAAQAVKGVANI